MIVIMSPLCTQKGRHIGSLLTAHDVCFSVCECAGVQTRHVHPMLGYCWLTVYDADPTLAQYWATVSCLAPG